VVSSCEWWYRHPNTQTEKKELCLRPKFSARKKKKKTLTEGVLVLSHTLLRVLCNYHSVLVRYDECEAGRRLIAVACPPTSRDEVGDLSSLITGW